MSIRHIDKGKPTDKSLGTGVVITVGVVPAVLASIVAIIVTIVCIIKKKWLIDYKLKQLVINNTEDYIKRLQEQIKNESRPEVLKELIKLMTVATERLLYPNGVPQIPITPAVTICTQTSVQSVTCRGSNINDIQVQLQQEQDDSYSQTNYACAPEGENVPERHKVSFQRRLSMEAMEPVDWYQSDNTHFNHLTNLFAAFISKAVRDSLLHASESNPMLAHKVEKEVRHAMFQRQQSIASSGVSYLEREYSCKSYGRSESEY